MDVYEDYYKQTINGDKIQHIAVNNNNYALVKKLQLPIKKYLFD